jgi:hypothetical protein
MCPVVGNTVVALGGSYVVEMWWLGHSRIQVSIPCVNIHSTPWSCAETAGVSDTRVRLGTQPCQTFYSAHNREMLESAFNKRHL